MALQKSTRCQQDVALTFTKHLFSTQDYQNENIVFSPLSLHVTLSVIAAGAQGGTLDQLLSFLRSDSVDHLNTFFSQVVSTVFSNDDVATPPSHHLSFANGMWVDKSLSLLHSFKQLVVTHYKATLDSVDFLNKANEVCDEVNSWVEKETNGLIKDLLPRGAVDKETKLIFANALHFKAEWEHKFKASLTTYHSDFYLLNGTSVKRVPFMTNDEEQYIRVFDGFKILGLPYRQGMDKKRRFSMYILLPDAKDGLSALIGKMASEPGFLEGRLPQQKVKLASFKIPRFDISFAFEASDVLKELGVVSPFSQGDADFTKMVKVNTPFDELYVESIFQKVFIKVHEEGTEAAAATIPALRGGGGPPQGLKFVADHPFLFLIREDFSGTILFVGQVLNPLGGANGTTTPVKEDLGRKKRSGPVDNAERSKKKYSDFELEKNG